MQDLAYITSGEWVLFAMAAVTLVNAAVVCVTLHRSLVRAEHHKPLHGLPGALADLPKRAGLKGRKAGS